MEIKSAEFVISNTNVKKCPTGDLPEYAFIGRSNVGKSSLINMLTGKKGLAMTSQKPGKNAAYQPFPHQRTMVFGRSPWLWFCPAGKRGTRKYPTDHRRLYLGTRTTHESVCPDRLSPRTAKDRLGVYGMARGKRNPLFSHLHKDRQNQ